jgi:hypothetical protein
MLAALIFSIFKKTGTPQSFVRWRDILRSPQFGNGEVKRQTILASRIDGIQETIGTPTLLTGEMQTNLFDRSPSQVMCVTEIINHPVLRPATSHLSVSHTIIRRTPNRMTESSCGIKMMMMCLSKLGVPLQSKNSQEACRIKLHAAKTPGYLGDRAHVFHTSTCRGQQVTEMRRALTNTPLL